MNTTLQAVLNLTAILEKLPHQPSESLVQLLMAPTFARLFLTALKNPGKEFRHAETFETLRELSAVITQINFLLSYDSFDLLNQIFPLLEKCEVQTAWKRRTDCLTFNHPIRLKPNTKQSFTSENATGSKEEQP